MKSTKIKEENGVKTINTDKTCGREPAHPNIDKLAQFIGNSRDKSKMERALLNLIGETHPVKSKEPLSTL